MLKSCLENDSKAIPRTVHVAENSPKTGRSVGTHTVVICIGALSLGDSAGAPL